MIKPIEQLIKETKDNEPRALEELYNRTKDQVKRIIIKISRNKETDDLAQEVYLEIIKTIKRAEIKSFNTWLYGLVKQTIYQSYRKKRLSKKMKEKMEFLKEEQEHNSNPEKIFEAKEQINKSISVLTKEEKELCNLYAAQELKTIEIARKTKTPYTTIDSRIKLIKRKIRNATD
jgi:RNA polymerase sigma factor (sigma-70 family)